MTMDPDESPRMRWIGSLLLQAIWLLISYGAALESWIMIAVALAIPIVVWLVCLLAADPRSD